MVYYHIAGYILINYVLQDFIQFHKQYKKQAQQSKERATFTRILGSLVSRQTGYENRIFTQPSEHMLVRNKQIYISERNGSMKGDRCFKFYKFAWISNTYCGLKKVRYSCICYRVNSSYRVHLRIQLNNISFTLQRWGWKSHQFNLFNQICTATNV